MRSLCDQMNGINYAEDDTAYVFTVSNSQNGSATRRFFCAWSDAGTLCDYIRSANSVTGLVELTVGLAHPNVSGIYASDISVKPDGKYLSNGAWEYAQLDVQYKPLAFDPQSPSIVRETDIKVVTDLQTLPQKSVKFDNGTNPPQFTTIDTDLLVCSMAYSVTLKGVTQVDMGTVCNSLNKVSSGNFTVRVGANVYSIAGDQVLYQGIDDVKSAFTSNSSSSVQKFDVTHNFLISPVSLTKVYNPQATGTTMADKYQATVPPRYDSANLMGLGV